MSENLMPHIRLPKDLDVDCVLLPGDPARADTVASHLEDAKLLASNREFRSWQGTYKGKKMLVTSTGIGAASCAIAVEELIQCGVHNLIRIGSCGALQPECTLGDLIFVTGAIRDDGTSAAYVEAQYPAIPDFDLLSACRESAVAENIPYHLGICRSHSCLYGDRNPELYSYWAGKRAIASDMETAALFVLGSLRGVRTASILNVVAASQSSVAEDIGKYVAKEAISMSGEEREILTALEAFTRIQK